MGQKGWEFNMLQSKGEELKRWLVWVDFSAGMEVDMMTTVYTAFLCSLSDLGFINQK